MRAHMSAEARRPSPWRRRRRDPRAAADMVRRFRAGGSAMGGGAAGMALLAGAWARVVGETGARHSEPVRRSRAGVVTIGCSSAAWAQELSARREELLESLRAAAPGEELSGLRFAVADHVAGAAERIAAPPPPRPVPAPGASDRATGARAAEGIGDERIRELIARLAATAAARRSGT
jgi:hypothetical protein